MLVNTIWVLLICTVLGSLTMVLGGQRFHLTARVMAVAFALTAASWMMLIVALIGWTVRTLVATSV